MEIQLCSFVHKNHNRQHSWKILDLIDFRAANEYYNPWGSSFKIIDIWIKTIEYVWYSNNSTLYKPKGVTSITWNFILNETHFVISDAHQVMPSYILSLASLVKLIAQLTLNLILFISRVYLLHYSNHRWYFCACPTVSCRSLRVSESFRIWSLHLESSTHNIMSIKNGVW